MSSRPKPKPKVCEAHRLQRDVAGEDQQVGPGDLLAVLLLDRPQQPAGLVEVRVVGPAVERGEALRAVAAAAAAVLDPVGAGGVPAHPDEQRPVVAVVGRPPVLRRRHDLDEVPLERLDVEARRTPRRSRSPRPSGWTRGECWWSTCRSSWFGHQSWFVCGRLGAGSGQGMTGFSLSLPCSDTSLASPVWCGGRSRWSARWWSLVAQVVAGTQAVGAAAPVDDLGLVDRRSRGRRTRSGRAPAPTAQSTSAIVAARPADDVVVVVPDPRLVARHRARRLDPADQPGRRSAPAARRRRPGGTRAGARARTAPMIESVSACGWSCTAASTASRGRVTRSGASRSIRSYSAVVGTRPTILPTSGTHQEGVGIRAEPRRRRAASPPVPPSGRR